MNRLPERGWATLLRRKWLLDFARREIIWRGHPDATDIRDLWDAARNLYPFIGPVNMAPLIALTDSNFVTGDGWTISDSAVQHLRGGSLECAKRGMKWMNIHVLGDLGPDEETVETAVFCNDTPDPSVNEATPIRPNERLDCFWPKGRLDILIPLKRYVQICASKPGYRSTTFIYPNRFCARWALPISGLHHKAAAQPEQRWGEDYYSVRSMCWNVQVQGNPVMFLPNSIA